MKKELIIGLLVMALLISGCTSAPPTTPQPRQTQPIITTIIQPTETHTAESSPTSAPLAQKIKIMPLGDSITFGWPNSSYGGYRHLLGTLLTNDGYNFDFVGSQQSGVGVIPDPDNEGHPGWTIPQIKDGIDSNGWLETYQPDLILLHIGTNDIYKGIEASAPANLSALLDDILGRLPKTHIIVAQIISDRSGVNTGIQSYDAAIPGIVASKGSRVSMVDMQNILSPGDYADVLHPNSSGYDKMARVWEPAILAVKPAVSTTLSAIPQSFFAMSTVNVTDYPKLTFGTLAHPEIGAWAWIERSKGVYDFALFDRYVSNAMAHGLVDGTNTASLAITLGSTPQWAAANPSSCEVKNGFAWCTSGPANIQDWNNFITAVMNHYNGATMPHVRYYELWNEANVKLFYTGTSADMVDMAKAAYPIVHADPHSMLLTPSVVGPVGNVSPLPPFAESATTWMARYLDAGGAQYADGGAFHGYIAETGVTPFPMPEQDSTPYCTGSKSAACYGSILTHATMMRQVFDQHGLAGKPMFDTEGSWGDDTVTDPDTQAAWLARWYLLQAGLRSADNLQMVAWFTWGDPKTFTWGTIEDASGAPTQAGIAFNQVENWLVHAEMNQPCSSAADGTWTCALTRPGGYTALAVWNTQGSKSYTSSAAYVDYRDLAGKTVKITNGAPVTIGVKPILLETLPSAQGAP